MIKVLIENQKYYPHIEYTLSVLLNGFDIEFISRNELNEHLNDEFLLIVYGASRIQGLKGPVIHIHESRQLWSNYLQEESLPDSWTNILVHQGWIKPYLKEGAIVSYYSNVDEDLVVFDSESIVISSDIVSAAFIFLTRYEEHIIKNYDQYGRFQAKNSILYHSNALDRPVVDEYSALILACVNKLIGHSDLIAPIKPKLRISHDIDCIYQYFRSSYPLRSFASLSLKHKKPLFALKKEFFTLLHDLGIKKQKPAFDHVFKYASDNAYQATVFFITHGETRYEMQYKINDPEVMAIIRRLESEGHLVGIHPSTVTWKNKEKMQREFKQFFDAVGYFPSVSRQHKLFVKLPETYRILEECGIKEDHSLGYGETPGFRAGTCRPFPYFDFITGRVLKLQIHPLIVMENVFHNSLRLTSGESKKKIDSLLQTTKFYCGEMSVLWHNTSFAGQYTQDWNNLFQEIITKAKQNGYELPSLD